MLRLLIVVGVFASSALAQRKPEVIRNSIDMDLVALPAGKFVMGSPTREEGRSKTEIPHTVTLSRGFLLGKFEVTNDQFRRFRGDHDSGLVKRFSFNYGNLPVVKVSMEDAEAYCKWLSDQPAEKAAGRVYRLPTEAEWEYACRAGTKTAYWWGDRVDPKKFNFSDRNDPGTPSDDEADDGSPITAPVGKYPPNPWGLCEMHGNAGEWVADRFGPYKDEPATDPLAVGPAINFGIERGGSWYGDADLARSAARVMRLRTMRGLNIGFRVACDVKTAPADGR